MPPDELRTISPAVYCGVVDVVEVVTVPAAVVAAALDPELPEQPIMDTLVTRRIISARKILPEFSIYNSYTTGD